MELIDETPTVEDRLESRTARAKRHWEEVWSNPIAAKRNWQIMAFSELAVILLQVGGLVYLGTIPRDRPYILERTSSGDVQYAGVVKPVDMDDTTWNQVKVNAFKQGLIIPWRTVTMDKTAQAAYWDRAFKYVGEGSQAQKALVAWYEQNDPIRRLDSGQLVSVQYETYDVPGDHTLGMWWKETTTDISGQVVSTKEWRARIVYTMHVLKSEDARAENGLGLLATELSWEEVRR